ncbi:MAG: hypothetical protein LBS71_01885 [Puniceicoccales bacterium]|nr:hypothetical protein [Puniceicoccales bacterium]
MKYFLLIISIFSYSFSVGYPRRTYLKINSTRSPTIFTQEIPSSKIRPPAYSGKLLRFQSTFWRSLFLSPNYEYYITDTKGHTVAFIDTTNLATGTSLVNLLGKTVTVNGSSFPHKYRGVMVVQAKYIVATANP